MSNINTLIDDFSTANLMAFLREKIPSFKPESEDFEHLFTDDIFDKYQSINKIGEATIDKDDLIVIASKTHEPLTERTGKKNQYQIAKTILKEEVKDASLFVFYDDDGNFRFSFVKANYLGTKRDYTDFKRYTYFVSPSQTNKTFIQQVGGCGFGSLNDIVEAFSVEPLNKQFYQDIVKSFYGLIGGKVKIGSRNVEFDASLVLPSMPASTHRKEYQEFAVRLIGRTIFCWFLKSKKSPKSVPLVPENWLSSNAVKEKDKETDNYYHAVLEKLFFLVLNKKMEDRKDYVLPAGHKSIPFLNGGLFEEQENDFFETLREGVSQVAHNLKIDNKWFIELFEVLEQYNFTIDENSIYDAEVSIDPEMLGTIFENLLAEIDPDTEKSARKATGSFYTPREIVDYMVEQSLVQYLMTKVATDNEEQLAALFKEGGENTLDKATTEKILEALSEVKILDPACGSGAFPMGALHKIINALQKLDPEATWWKDRQIKNVPNVLAKQMLKEKLDSESADYVRKLGVIQNSIYGIDIQPVATEISKLRCFLSLVIDETINDDADNRGIQALPNLEFKFVTANTLIGLEDKSISTMDFGNTNELQDKLKDIRNDYLQAYGEKKQKLKEKFDDIQTEIFNKELEDGYHNKRAKQLSSWKPFSNEVSPWFDPYWMFGIKKFDIVIGNPPYVEAKKLKKIVVELRDYMVYSGTADLSSYFFERGLNLCKKRGHLCLINTNKFFNTGYGKKVRKLLLESNIKQIINFEQVEVFEGVLVSSVIVLTENSKKNNKFLKYSNFYRLNKEKFIQKFINIYKETKPYLKKYINEDEWSFANESELNIKDKIEHISENLGNIEGVEIYRGVTTGYNKAFIIDFKDEKKLVSINSNNKEIIKPILQGRNIRKWKYHDSFNRFLQTGFDINIKKNYPDIYTHLLEFETHLSKRVDKGKNWWNLRACAYNTEFEKKEKIIWGLTADKWAFAYDDKQHYLPSNGYILTSEHISIKYLLGLLNSNLLKFYFNFVGIMTAGGAYTLKHGTIKKLPIPKEKKQDKVEKIVNQILEMKKENDDVHLYENELNIIVYKLYTLTHKEVLIIDPEFTLSEEEYDNYKIE